MAANNMFVILNKVTQLVDEGRPDEAYQLIKDTVEDDPRGFAISFLAEWMEHLAHEEEAVRNKFAEIVLFLRDDYSEQLAKTSEEVSLTPGVELLIPDRTLVQAPAAEEPTPVTTAPEITEELVKEEVQELTPVEPEPATAVAVKRKSKSAPQTKHPTHREAVTLTFYDWQMAALTKAATREGTDENSVLAKILQTGNTRPVSFARYRSGPASPVNRLTVTIPHRTKVSLEKQKTEEGIKTTTKYVRKLLFGNRAEKA